MTGVILIAVAVMIFFSLLLREFKDNRELTMLFIAAIALTPLSVALTYFILNF